MGRKGGQDVGGGIGVGRGSSDVGSDSEGAEVTGDGGVVAEERGEK